MNWDAVSALSELLAAIGVIVSLVYLAAQIRQNTREVHEQTRSNQLSSLTAVGHNFLSFRLSVGGNQQVASVWTQGNPDLTLLSAEERLQFDYHAVEFFWALAMMWLYVQQGVFERELFDHSRATVPLYAGPGLQEWWRTSQFRGSYPQGFIPEIDEIFSQMSPPQAGSHEPGSSIAAS